MLTPLYLTNQSQIQPLLVKWLFKRSTPILQWRSGHHGGSAPLRGYQSDPTRHEAILYVFTFLFTVRILLGSDSVLLSRVSEFGGSYYFVCFVFSLWFWFFSCYFIIFFLHYYSDFIVASMYNFLKYCKLFDGFFILCCCWPIRIVMFLRYSRQAWMKDYYYTDYSMHFPLLITYI